MLKNYDATLFNLIFTEWDKKIGLIDDKGNPLNGMLSAKDNKKLFDSFVSEWTSFKNRSENKDGEDDSIIEIKMPSLEDYQEFNQFLHETEVVVRYGHKNTSVYKDNIDKLIDRFGSEKLVLFLD